MKKIIVLSILILLVFTLFPAPDAQAMDPVTIALLTPVAIKLAKVAQPYVIKGLSNGLKQMLVMGGDILGIMRLPLGLMQTIFLAPFGQFAKGVRNIILGGVAPFKLAFHAVLLPVKLFGM